MPPVTPAHPESLHHGPTFDVAAGTGQGGQCGADVPLFRAAACADTRADTSAAADAVLDRATTLVPLLAHLRATVITYVGRRRADGALLERVLPDVRVLVRAAVTDDAEREVIETLVSQVVRWSIEAYSGATAGVTPDAQPRVIRVARSH